MVNYINNHTKIKLGCPVHGFFEVRPNDHLSKNVGCNKCNNSGISKSKNMKKFIQENFTTIVLIIMLFTFFKGCSDSRELSKIRKEIQSIKDSTYTKVELDRELKIMGLEAEKRMIQATDRKILDVQRQTQIEEEIKKLKK